MRYSRSFLGYVLIFFLLMGCAAVTGSEPVFPDDQVPAIISVTDFDRIWDNLDNYKGMTVKIAGRIVDTTQTSDGAITLANWIPYVSHFELEDGPPDQTHLHLRHFAFLFPGIAGDPFAKGPDYDQQIAWEGNKFVMEGSVEGSRTMVVNPLGKEQTMLLVRTQCIHVWETGESEPSDQPDSQWADHIARTFCVRGTR